MAKLYELAKLVRAKNAGAFTLTFDIVFEDAASYQAVKRSGAITPALLARLYGVPEEQVQFFEHDTALALKASIPRPVSSGDPDDTDVFGGQQHSPLVDLEIPVGSQESGVRSQESGERPMNYPRPPTPDSWPRERSEPSRLRRLLERPGLIVAPACFDPLTARIAREVGFECLALGGYVLGAQSAVSEPLLTLTEVAEAARRIVTAAELPLVVDVGAGFGDPLHVTRTVRELEAAGAAAIHVEDQVFPKRAHYHRDYREHTIPAEEMALKVRYACAARRDSDFVIIARTDAMRTEGYEEGIRRANLYAEAGADMVMLFPNTTEEAKRAPGECRAPLVYVNSSGNRVNRPVFATQELEAMGYKMAYDAIALAIASYRATRDALERLRASGRTGLDQELAIATRKAIEDTIGLEDHYKIEEQTVERESR